MEMKIKFKKSTNTRNVKFELHGTSIGVVKQEGKVTLAHAC